MMIPSEWRRRKARSMWMRGDINCPECQRLMFFADIESQKDYEARYVIEMKCMPTPKLHRYMRLSVDHITPKSKGGQDDVNNYQIMCTGCNSEKGAEESKL